MKANKQHKIFDIFLLLLGLIWLSLTMNFYDQEVEAFQPSSSMSSPAVTATTSNQKAPAVQSSREIEKQIVDKILGEGYDKRIRPAGTFILNASKPGGGT